MKHLLLDTHVLLWAAAGDAQLPTTAAKRIDDADTQPLFSAASIWEVVIKSGLGRNDFQVDPALLRRGLLDNGYEELAISSAHTLAVSRLPDLHKDPFDRILVAQAIEEGIEFLTCDQALAAYAGPITLIT